MRYLASKYNVFFNYGNSLVGFNGYTQEYILIEPLLYEIYKVGEKKRDFGELEEVHADFYKFLIDQGFLVDETVDEFERVKELSKAIDNDSSTFQLIVNPTMNCNFKCWYCYETHIKDSKMDASTLEAAIKLAQNVVNTQVGLQHFSLSFFGGEPLLYFSKVVEPLLTRVSAICRERQISFSAGMTTNGLLINQEMLAVCKQNGFSGFQITLDGCKHQHDKVRFISEGKGSYDKIVNNIILAAKNQIRVNVRINCSAETLVGLHDIIEDFGDLNDNERQYLNFDIHKVWQTVEDIDFQLQEARIFFNSKGFKVSCASHNTVADSCYGDKRYQATLNYNGEVFKCTARDFTNGSGEGELAANGEILWNEKFEKRLDSKFKNRPCLECKILPICGGGCTQQAVEHDGRDYCVQNFDEDKKTQVVVDRFRTLVAV